jgi:transposase InsO family protein
MGQFNNDDTLQRNYIAKWVFLIEEYDQVKRKEHPKFRRVKDFYRAHGICAQNFLKYRGRYYSNSCGDVEQLLPRKRGPRWKGRIEPSPIELDALLARDRGCSRHEIYEILKRLHPQKAVPRPSTIYRLLKRYGKNRLTCKMKQEKREFIKRVMGHLAHIDCHHLSKEMIFGSSKRYYLLCVLDHTTRVANVELLEDIKSLTVMFATMRSFQYFKVNHGIQFEQVLTDNGAEFNGKLSPLNHPFERLLLEMEVKHAFIRPYRPQTNGRVERFWRTLQYDLIEETFFESIDHFKKELREYLVYYNYARPHQALAGMAPGNYAQKNQQIPSPN